MRRNDFHPTKTTYLCGKHFTEEDFEVGGLIRRLKPDAIPRIFYFPNHLLLRWHGHKKGHQLAEIISQAVSKLLEVGMSPKALVCDGLRANLTMMTELGARLSPPEKPYIEVHGVRLFPLGKPNLLKKWVQVMRRKDFHPTKTIYLCGKHFTEEDFEVGGLIRRLKPDAIPSIFDFPNHLLKVIKERQAPKKRKRSLSPVMDGKLVATEHNYSNSLEVSPRKMRREMEKLKAKFERQLTTLRQKTARKSGRIMQLSKVIQELEEKNILSDQGMASIERFKPLAQTIFLNEKRNCETTRQGHQLAEIISQAVSKLLEVGMSPKALVCDGLRANLTMMTELGARLSPPEKPYIEVHGVRLLFDVLNCSNPYGRGYKSPLRPETEYVWQLFLNEMEGKLRNLLMPDGSAVAAQPRVGALGLIVDIKSVSEGLNCLLLETKANDMSASLEKKVILSERAPQVQGRNLSGQAVDAAIHLVPPVRKISC
ncbi:unnamed protein product, partial [Darwinula stevensoni]